MKLFYHPVSSYSQKVLVALHEKGAAFETRLVDPMGIREDSEFRALNPLARVPFLQVDGIGIPESSIIIEYLDQHLPGGPRLIPADPEQARQVRLLDRIFDLHLGDPLSRMLLDRFRPAGTQDAYGVRQCLQRVDNTLAEIDRRLAGREWALGDSFTMADCAAAPHLAYAQRLHLFDHLDNVSAYFRRLCARPSFARVLADVEPYLEAFRARATPAPSQVATA